LAANDPAGNPRELFSLGGDVLWRGQYSSWGEVTTTVAVTDCPIRFEGQWHDDETGLHYNRARYYDPAIGIFLSPDPIGLQGGANLFAYAPNATGWTDPLGLAALRRPCGLSTDKPEGAALLRLLNTLARRKRLNTAAVAVGVVDIRSGRSTANIAGPPPRNLHPALAERIKAMGGVCLCKNTPAACAEIRAANTLLHKGAKIEDLRFTKPIRPRTGQAVNVCRNCQFLLPEAMFPPDTPID
jgi:RHS repeat-associated protein